MARAISRCLFLLALTWAPVASACPQCAGNEKGIGDYFMLSAMILAPYLVVAVIIPAIRKVLADEAETLPRLDGAEIGDA